jgi:small redox-active disulfide protein 2
MDIKVLGGCCKKCEVLYDIVLEVVKENGIEAKVEKVNNPIEVAKYGVMATPGLVVNGKVLSYGKMLKKEEVIKLIVK